MSSQAVTKLPQSLYIRDTMYSRKQWIKAVNTSALLGWAFVVTPMAVVNASIAPLIFGALFGLPIAYLCSWLIGAPILKHVMRNEIGWLAAAKWGATISFLIALLSIALGRYNGWLRSRNPNFGSYSGREVDGILTTYGWLLLAQSTVLFILAGAVVGLLVRWWIGSPANIEDATET